MTVADLIKRSLRLIGVIASGEAPSASDQQDALDAMNSMLDSFSNDGLVIPKYEREVFKLNAGQSSYTIGVGGNLNTDRFMSVTKAKAGTLITNEIVTEIPAENESDPPTIEISYSYDIDLEMPVRILNIQEWADIQLKKMQSNFVQAIYTEGSFPLEKIHVWPVPQQESALVLYSHKPLTIFEEPTDELNLPPGYEELIVYNLASRLGIEYGKQPNAKIDQIAIDSIAKIKRKNEQPLFMKSDVLGIESNNGRYNIYTGEYDA